MKDILKKNIKSILGVFIIAFLSFCMILNSEKNINTIETNGRVVSNKKIEWGLKRNDNHNQPDLGKINKELMDKYDGMAMGNKDSKKVYLTFDNGYEAGYTEKILEVLKQNDVKACFFVTAHYVNTASDLVKRMIDDGHIVGNQLPPSQMYQI